MILFSRARPILSVCSSSFNVTRSSSSSSSSVSMSESTLALAEGILRGRRNSLSRAITLVESARDDHAKQAELLLSHLAASQTNYRPARPLGNSFTARQTLRLGVAGAPGAGKSTFIEALGMKLIEQSHKVAVIPIDPSSHISGGSVLGDKTRMDMLSKSEHSYVRASPTRGVLGGIAEHSADVISLCEAAGYDIVIVESVGVGQSEVEIDNAVDMLLVIVPPGGGDSLQAAKKGIMEAADLVIVNKADGSLLTAAKHTKADYASAMQFIRQKVSTWRAKVLMMSAKTSEGLNEVLEHIVKFHSTMEMRGQLLAKRTAQKKHLMWTQVRKKIINDVENTKRVIERSVKIERELAEGTVTPRAAASELIKEYYDAKRIHL